MYTVVLCVAELRAGLRNLLWCNMFGVVLEVSTAAASSDRGIHLCPHQERDLCYSGMLVCNEPERCRKIFEMDKTQHAACIENSVRMLCSAAYRPG